jgi:hypothetical protein
MKKTLQFSTTISARRPRVWDVMLGPETYKEWTTPFCAGSHYVGSWDQGAKIRFLAPSGDGMTAEIAENRLHEFISIRHLGEVAGGVDDTTSDRVRAWAPAYENYAFVDSPAGTEVRVSVDVTPEYEAAMNDMFPKALAKLKALCEIPG